MVLDDNFYDTAALFFYFKGLGLHSRLCAEHEATLEEGEGERD